MAMLEKYYRFNKVAGINIEINKDGCPIFHVCTLTINGNKLTVEQKIAGLSDVNELKKLIPAKTPVAINLVGKGILIKQTDRIDEEENLKFSSILPNVNEHDFYTQLFTSGSKSYVSLIRRQEADKWISNLKGVGFMPLVLSLGPFAVSQIVTQLNVYGPELVFNGHVIQRNEQQDWTNYKYTEFASAVFSYRVENEQIDEQVLTPYASAFQLALYPNISLIKANISALHTELLKHSGRLKLKVQGLVVLGVFFVLLLANFLMLTYYSSSNLNMAVKVGQTVKMASNAASLDDSLKTKQQLLASIGWEGKMNKSIMLDQIAQLLPTEVSWQQVAIDPLGSNPDHGIGQNVFASRQIKIMGISERLIPVNEWIARLKTKRWIKNVELQNYNFNNELNTGKFVVTITY